MFNSLGRIPLAVGVLFVHSFFPHTTGAAGPPSHEVRVGNALYSIAEAERIERADERLTRYARFREQKAGSLIGEVQLAQWCDRNELPEQAKAHWLQVLRINSRDKRALKALDVQWYRGTLMTNGRADELRAFETSVQLQLKQSQQKIRDWRRAVTEGDDTERDAALKELRWSCDGQMAKS